MSSLEILRDPNTSEQNRPIGIVNESKTHVDTTRVTDVTMVYKNHLDVGFTESAAKVTHDAIHWMLGVAIDLDQQLQDIGKRFVWTTPSWVIHEALEICSGNERARIERGIKNGCLAWHALPFTCHTGLLSAAMIDAGIHLSKGLDQRFGRRTRSAKLTDVPGHSLGLVPRLAAAGIELLHIGVNHMSALCQVPSAFRWRHQETESEVVVYYGSGYGGTHSLEQDSHTLLWRMVGDNCEVPSYVDVLHDYQLTQKHFPDARIQVGRIDDYLGSDFQARSRHLPVITQDLGDSWIHGTGSDPYKTQRFRALQRLANEWIADKKLLPNSKAYIDFGKNMNLVAEHTWGVNFNAHNHHDTTHFNQSDFQDFRKRGAIKVIEASWQEQRDYIDIACEALPPELQESAMHAIQDCLAIRPNLSEWKSCTEELTFSTAHGRVRIDEHSGAIASYVVAGQERCQGLLGSFSYQTFDHDDCVRFCNNYNRGSKRIEEFTKLGLLDSDAVSAIWQAQRQRTWHRNSDSAIEILSAITLPKDAIELFGAAPEIYLQFTFPHAQDQVDGELQWFNKSACRMPEATWWSFQPQVESPNDWQFDCCGQWLNPHHVIQGGGRELHAVEIGARNKALQLISLDAHLIAPGKKQLYRFNETPVDCTEGLHLNLHNNCWGTNFVMWFEDDCRFRSSLVWG